MADSDRPETEEPSKTQAADAPPQTGEGAGTPPPAGATAPVRATPVEQPKMGAFARVLSVFVSPGAVFTDIARKPSWVLALLIMIGFGVGMQIVTVPHIDMAATIQARMAKSGRQLSDAQMDKALSMSSKLKWLGVPGAIIGTPIVFLIVALVFWLGVKLLGSDSGFLAMLSTALHAFLPASVIASIVGAVIVGRSGMLSANALKHAVKSNLDAFLPHTAPWYLHALAAPLDVFTLWEMALMAIGLSIVAKLSRGRAIGLVIVVFLLYLALRLGFAGIGHAFGG